MDDIYTVIIPIDFGAARGLSTFAKRKIKQFEVLGPYAGVLREGEKDFKQGMRKIGKRNFSAYLFGTISEHRAIDAFGSGNTLSLVNTGQLGKGERIEDNNTSAVQIGKSLIFYVANRDIDKGEEFFVDYGPIYDCEIKQEPTETE